MEEAAEFLNQIDEKARDKIIYNIHKSRVSNDNELFKKLNKHTWEFRTLFNKTYYRLFAFWDKKDKIETVVVSTHGIIKKTDKIVQADLDKAERLMNLYFERKLKIK